nr:CehA/McbA family metallohydrolase [Kofleriaceae bacterium]
MCACGGSSGPSLDDFLPPIPAPTGAAQVSSAGQVTDPSQLLTGPAQSGLVGDFFIKNDKVSFIVQAPTRVIGVIPQGGNVVDAALLDANGKQATDDHFGELGLIYLLGRTCEPTEVTIVRDGSKGGVAVLEARGKSGNDDFINLKGIGVLPVDAAVDPDITDGIDCATTYILEPGSTTLQVYHSLFNRGPDRVNGPMGTIADTGGNTEAFTNARGFARADISALATLSQPQPSDFTVYQGPGVSYGVIPRHDTPTTHTQALIAGVSIILDGDSALLDILNADKYFLHLQPNAGLVQRYDLVVGHDGQDSDVVFRSGNGEPLQAVSGKVSMSDGAPAVGARVGVFVDGNHNGVLDDATVDLDGDGQPDDKIISYMDVATDGTFSGQVATQAGDLLLRAEVKNVGRSDAAPVAGTLNFTIPAPIQIGFDILDDATGQPMPGRLIVIGDHPAFPDQRVFETFDRQVGVVTQQHCIHGTSTDVGAGADPVISLPAGGTYRVYASRGTEWSVDSQPVTASGTLTFHLKQVNPTPGYYATDWHIHQVGSPDSNILSDERVRSAVSQGVEMFAVTDHDYVSDLQPIVETLGVQQYLRVIPGIEMTPFAYGHYQAWPMTPDNNSANHGAVDWARGATAGDAMTPGEIYAAARAKGAQMIQVNHPRSTGFTEFQSAFIRANVQYDFDNRTIFGDYQNADLPNEALRLPGESLWSDQFNGLEIWNGFAMTDTNGDGLRECTSLDRTMWDWLSMLSMGFYVTPAGNSDTHTTVADPAGMPRTYVRVANDTSDALVDGTAVDAVLQTQTGANNTPRDVVVTDGPMIGVTVGSGAAAMSALGSVVPAVNTSVTLTVTITSPDWAEFDTLEVFANTTPGAPPATGDTTLVPLKCFTSRDLGSLDAKDPCARAALAPEAMTVTLAQIPGSGSATYQRFEATLTITLDASDIANRAGATGKDAWLVFRARGNRAIFPVLVQNVVTDATKAAVLSGDFATLRTAMTGIGPIAEAVTAPVFVDFDGGGYRAPFAP